MEERIDKALYILQVVRSRSEAEDLIKRGLVSVKNREGKFVQVTKASKLIDPQRLTKDDIQIKTNQYVSRGAYKLLKALDEWNIEIENTTALDIGASTGGFTEVLLEKGVKCVFAVDVGTEQLDPKIKKDPRVVSLENTDIQKLKELPKAERVNFFVADISFISITKIIPHLERFVSQNAKGVLLIKPQFEVGKEYLSKSGIVKSDKAVKNAITQIRNVLREYNFKLLGEIESPIQGGSGNTEYLWYVEN